MKVTIIGKNGFRLTDPIKEYAEKKLQKLNKFFTYSDDLTATVVMKIYKDHQKVEITIPAKHITLRVEVADDTVYGAIDIALDKLEQQIRKYKTKINKSIQEREGVANFFSEELDLEALEKEIIANELVRNKKIELLPMSADEAINQMELLGHDFFIFKDKKTGRTNVVYVREDGDYAIIETT